MSDSISRQAAIDALWKIKDERDSVYYTSAIHSSIDAIERLPSVEPERKIRWIPCSERLPEQNGQYLTFHNFHGLNIYNVYRFGTDLYEIDNFDFYDFKGVSGWYDYDSEYGYFLEDVDAWMPLPEPYREVEHDKS